MGRLSNADKRVIELSKQPHTHALIVTVNGAKESYLTGTNDQIARWYNQVYTDALKTHVVKIADDSFSYTTGYGERKFFVKPL